MPVTCAETDSACLHRWNDKNETGSCPTKWPYGNSTDAVWLRPAKTSDGSQTCPWIDLIEASGGGSTGISKALFAGCVLTCIFNLLLSYIILSQRELRKQRSLLFLISIGASDVANSFYLLLINRPSLISHRYLPWISSDPVICKLHQIVSSFLFCAPWWNFLGLMLDRLYAVKRPIDYKKKSIDGKGYRAILSCWAFTLVPGLPLWFDQTIAEDMASGCSCYFPLRNTGWLIYSVVIGFALPVLLILITWVTLAHHFFAHPSNELRNCTLKLIFITGLFLTTIFPFCLQFVYAISVTPCITTAMDKSIIFAFLNSLVQPVLCLAIITQIREAAWRIVTCKPSPTELRRQLTRQGTGLSRQDTRN